MKTINSIPNNLNSNWNTHNLNTGDLLNNFTHEVNIWLNKIARSFPKFDLRQSYSQLGNREYPEFFYIRTASDNIYLLMSSSSAKMIQLFTQFSGNKHWGTVINGHSIMTWFPEWYVLYNPKTNTFSQSDNPLIEVGKPYLFSPWNKKAGNTSSISEIIGVSESIGKTPTNRPSSDIVRNFDILNKDNMNRPFAVILL